MEVANFCAAMDTLIDQDEIELAPRTLVRTIIMTYMHDVHCIILPGCTRSSELIGLQSCTSAVGSLQTHHSKIS